MQRSKPKISIITAVRNSADTVESCIRSIREQSYKSIEHIVIDGASTDGSIEIIKKHSNSITRIVSEPDKGIYDAMNKGISLASGDIIGILNSDDLYADSEVLSSVGRVLSNTAVDSCYGDLVYVAPLDTERIIRYWKSSPYNDKLFYKGWMPPHPTFFVKRAIYEKVGLYRLDLGSAADYELMLRLLLKSGISTIYIPRVLVKMRCGGKSNASLLNRLNANRYDRKAWEVNGLRPKPWTLLMKPISKIKQYFSKPNEI